MSTAEKDQTPSVEVVLRRFFREIQQADIMTEIKRRRFFEKKMSRNSRRTVARERLKRQNNRFSY